MDPERLAATKAATAQLIKDGSPVFQTVTADRLIAVGWRRWCSFERRDKGRNGRFEERVEDLAKGLRSSIEPDSSLVWPLMKDYRHLAIALAEVFSSDPTPPAHS